MRNIFFLGLISFFTDISAEMVYPLIPLYLVSAFGATPALVGIIEGIAESLASLLKVYSGSRIYHIFAVLSGVCLCELSNLNDGGIRTLRRIHSDDYRCGTSVCGRNIAARVKGNHAWTTLHRGRNCAVAGKRDCRTALERLWRGCAIHVRCRLGVCGSVDFDVFYEKKLRIFHKKMTYCCYHNEIFRIFAKNSQIHLL